MIANILFSLNATIPLFIVMAVGFLIRKLKVVDETFIKSANNFNFKVTIPALLFLDMATSDFRETFDLKFLLFCMITTSVIFWGLWGISRAVMKDKSSVAEFVQASYRASLAVNGMALVESISGNTSMAGMMMLGTVPLYNIYAVILLQSSSPAMDRSDASGQKGRMKTTLLGIAKNPIIISILAGFLWSLIGIKFPQFIETSLHYVGRIGTPFALICIGADFDFRKAFGKLGKSGLASAIKLIISPVIFVTIAILLGFRDEKLVSILVSLAAPTTPVSFIMAKQYGHDGTITSSAVALTTLLSCFTMAAFIFVLKTLSFI